jgi:hypothetical protein
VRYPIPLKSGCPALPEPQIGLNWITGMMTGGIMLFEAIVPPAPADDLPEDVRHKHKNTIAFAEHCKNVPLRASIAWDSIPVA